MNSTLSVFCNQLHNFNKTLSDRFPENKDLSLCLTAVETLKSSNSKKLIEIYVLYIYKYKSDVMNKNEKFLLETNFLDNYRDMSDIDYQIMNNLKLNWRSLDDNEKESIWKYLQVLMKLVDKYLSETLK